MEAICVNLNEEDCGRRFRRPLESSSHKEVRGHFRRVHIQKSQLVKLRIYGQPDGASIGFLYPPLIALFHLSV